MAYTNIWDESQPADTQPANQLGLDIRNLEVNVRERLGTFLSGPITSRPTPEAAWAGLIYIATDLTGGVNIVSRWDGNQWIDITASFSNAGSIKIATLAPVVTAGIADGVLAVIPASTLQAGSVINVEALIIPTPASSEDYQLAFGGASLALATAVAANLIFRAQITVVDPTHQWGTVFIGQASGFGINANFAFTSDVTTPLTIKTQQLTNNGGGATHEFITVVVKR